MSTRLRSRLLQSHDISEDTVDFVGIDSVGNCGSIPF